MVIIQAAMSTSSIQAIIFDFGGVLLDWNPRHVYRRYFADPDEMERFLVEIDFASWNQQQDGGRPFAEGVSELSGRFPQHAALIRAYHEHWEDSVSGPIPGTVEILRALKAAGHPVYGLSNWSAETFPLAYRKYDVFRLLDGYIISGDVGVVKPDPLIFDLLLQQVGRPAAACLLIDDSVQNIETAQRLGFQTILFRSPDSLAEELHHLALLPAGG
jgi:2-haloacid dehalogenase